MDTASIAERFRRFAEVECRGSSPLYFELARRVADDETALRVAARAGPGQPIPNLLLASVHYLLVEDAAHPLREYYGSLVQQPKPATQAYPAFRDFLLARRSEIERLLSSRRVQTNEVRRCAYLFPAFLHSAAAFPSRPLALVEIGCSAGLNLLWDRYAYGYGGPERFGQPDTPVFIESSWRGAAAPALGLRIPEVSRRIGIDLQTPDTRDPDQAAWLKALVWPDQRDRLDLLRSALDYRRGCELDLRQGDGFALLPELARQIPAKEVICVFHTHVANQISAETRSKFLRSVHQLGRQRDLIHVYNNMGDGLRFARYLGGEASEGLLAYADGHARWIDWQAGAPAKVGQPN